jgi:hypothetical protein
LELPALGRLVLRDAETGEVIEINTGDAQRRDAFSLRQTKALGETAKRCSAPPGLTRSSYAPINLTAWRWPSFLRRARNGGGTDECESKV